MKSGTKDLKDKGDGGASKTISRGDTLQPTSARLEKPIKSRGLDQKVCEAHPGSVRREKARRRKNRQPISKGAFSRTEETWESSNAKRNKAEEGKEHKTGQ